MEDFLSKQYQKIDEMDFEGQKSSEAIYKYTIAFATFVAAIVGYLLQDMTIATIIILAVALLVTLISGIAWSPFKSSPIKFLKPFEKVSPEEDEDKDTK
eukprot:CAMPEP_0205827666 /NCGR_PEP_ID=MMETSP0206-20130828/32772_1 /ASSEMBLY_ACC=CAM_ASM_000279 /TAXON_ID=36767 /ORGANISM="Euplotes focardii, Strain TN1" /LENGTH=98 /DNA_ID=CAMNT_0053128793 /DNA_START=23 /DNA_END=322 /DNA_ORIENTATION=-